MSLEVQDTTLSTIKCEIKTEELEVDEMDCIPCDGVAHTYREQMETPALTVTGECKHPIKQEFRSESRPDEVNVMSDPFNQHGNPLLMKTTPLSRMKCPGCSRSFWNDGPGLKNLSYHIISCHRQKRKVYMYSLRLKYAPPGVLRRLCNLKRTRRTGGL
ncbi:hypothetical protein ONE63_002828 [Megalurothrips usitatus]|uniref:C2H2-type domain-containing protein n=1 Tax=Megalurothrips usitatus TaxID=439358 RepID=A0AAV7X5F8_9NEOP|nr:hypothetical protein ONE63_002828 [Megalurothrips usitatus]